MSGVVKVAAIRGTMPGGIMVYSMAVAVKYKIGKKFVFAGMDRVSEETEDAGMKIPSLPLCTRISVMTTTGRLIIDPWGYDFRAWDKI
jgi:hypothetical protein